MRAQIALKTLARVAVFCGCVAFAPTSRADLWVTAYYAGWNQAYLPPSQIDFGAVTHVIHFSLVPNSDGSLNTNANVITPATTT